LKTVWFAFVAALIPIHACIAQSRLPPGPLEIAPLMGINAHGMPAKKAAQEVVAAVRSLRDDIKITSKLSDVGMKESDIPQFVDDAQKSQGLFIASPKPPTAEDLAAIYKSAL